MYFYGPWPKHRFERMSISSLSALEALAEVQSTIPAYRLSSSKLNRSLREMPCSAASETSASLKIGDSSSDAVIRVCLLKACKKRDSLTKAGMKGSAAVSVGSTVVSGGESEMGDTASKSGEA